MKRITLIVLLATVLASCGGNGNDNQATGSEGAADSPTPAPPAGICTLSNDPQAWGVDGNGGWARQWVLGQCALANSSVITFIDLASDCRSQQQASCEELDILAACGPATVALQAADCIHCQTACVASGAECKAGVCSNTGQPCDNNQQCSFSRPVDGSCSDGSTLVEDWAQYYALQGGTGEAPMTYCAWN